MKKESQLWYFTIEIDVLNTFLTVIVCDNKEVLDSYAPRIDKKIGKENIVSSFVSKVIMNEDYLYSQTYQVNNIYGDIIVLFNSSDINKVPLEDMVHEFHHASSFLCDFRGIDDEETETYVQQYLFNQMLCKINEWKNSQKKAKRKPKKKA